MLFAGWGMSSPDPPGWTLRPLSDLVVNEDRRRVPLSSVERSTRQGPFPYWGANGPLDSVDDFIFDGERILLAEDGTVQTDGGKPVVHLATGRYWVNNHAHVISGGPDVDLYWLYYALKMVDIAPFLTGSVQPKLSQTNMNRIELLTPSLDEQVAIGSVLRSLDEKIAANRRIADTARRLSGELFRAFFVDFDPVRTNRDGSHPSPITCGALLSIFPDDWDEAEGELLPAGWSLQQLSSIGRFVNGGAFTKGASGFGRPIVRIAEMKGGLGASTVYSDTEVPDQQLATVGDILFAWSGSLCVERWTLPDAIINQHIFKCIPADGIPDWVLEGFLECALPEFIAIAADKATTMGHIRRGDLDLPQCAIPPVAVLDALDSIFAPLVKLRLHALQENVRLAGGRDALLPQLIGGQLRVGEGAP